jgi:phage-related protein
MRPLHWIAASKKDYVDFPKAVQDEFGYAFFIAQNCEKPDTAKPLHGFGGAGVLELVESHDGEAYRAVYTVKFEEAVYVCFQKKSKVGRATPKQEIDLIRARLKLAEERHELWKKTK